MTRPDRGPMLTAPALEAGAPALDFRGWLLGRTKGIEWANWACTNGWSASRMS